MALGLGLLWLLVGLAQAGAAAPPCPDAGSAALACYKEEARSALGETDRALAGLLAALRAAETARPASPDLTAAALSVHALAESDAEAHCRLRAAALPGDAVMPRCLAGLAQQRLAQIAADAAAIAGRTPERRPWRWAEEPGRQAALCPENGELGARLSCVVRRRDEDRARLQGAYDALEASGLDREAVDAARRAFFDYAEAECRLVRDMTPSESRPGEAMIAFPCEAAAAAGRTARLRALRREAEFNRRTAAPEGP